MITIKKIDPKRLDERGSIYELLIRPTKHVYVMHRKAGTISGDHYHLGNIASKSPETFYVVSGKVRLVVRNIDTDEKETHELGENTFLQIPARIHHQFIALTDFSFLEFNVDHEDFEKDTVKS